MSSPPTRRARRLPDVCSVSHKQALKASNYRIHRINHFGNDFIYTHNRYNNETIQLILTVWFLLIYSDTK
ncbi:hypothetical protein DVQ16_18460 [Yersinia enterocolitica]|nr:hypothetical protein [Yersinia enterocolitica]